MNKLRMQIRREFWECRASFIRTPLVLAAILMGLLLLGMIPLQERIGQVVQHAQSPLTADLDLHSAPQAPELMGTNPAYLIHGLASVYTLFTLVLLLVLAFYFTDALYTDRRDRSILFWKSLPVAERITMLSKLLAGSLGAPFMYGVAAIATGGFFLLVFLVYAGIIWNIPVPSIGTVVATYLSSIVGLVLGWCFFALWLLPIFAWLLFSSAFARKTPFLVALGVPAGVMVLEGWFLGSGNMFGVIKRQITAGMADFQVAIHNPWAVGGELAEALAAPAFWVGLALSGALLCGCVWLRQHRWEI